MKLIFGVPGVEDGLARWLLYVLQGVGLSLFVAMVLFLYSLRHVQAH